MTLPFAKTKIVCTLGPSCSSYETLEKLLLAGMTVARLNFAHGDHQEHKNLFKMVRTLSLKYDQPVSIICQIQGPKIRVGKVEKPFILATGDLINVTSETILSDPNRLSLCYPPLLYELEIGDSIYVNDGRVKLNVTAKTSDNLLCEVKSGGQISDRKGCNIPKADFAINVLTQKDLDDLSFIATLEPEFVEASFVGDAQDVSNVREVLKKHGKGNIKIISKIERPTALKHLEEIVQASDAIMIARGDLGVDIPPANVPRVQKDLIEMCNRSGKPVIVATQMLESMLTSSNPTRSEVSDVFNAVLDGTDAVMLSEETAVGEHAVEAVIYLKSIVVSAENHLQPKEINCYNTLTAHDTIAKAAATLAQSFQDCKFRGKIIVSSEEVSHVSMISKYRLKTPIIAFSSNIRIARELNLVWGVIPLYSKQVTIGKGMEERVRAAVHTACPLGLLEENDQVIVISGSTLPECRNDGVWVGMFRVDQMLQQGTGV